jgi:hypothetical protein
MITAERTRDQLLLAEEAMAARWENVAIREREPRRAGQADTFAERR